MLRNYLKIAFRNISRNKVYSGINIIGLAMGLAICLLIMLYIFDEVGYDKHHKNGDQLYRITTRNMKGESWASASAPVAFTVKQSLPEVVQATRLLKLPNIDKIQVKRNDLPDAKQFSEANAYYADSTFFQLFTYEFEYGNGATALNQPNTLVLSEALSRKLFGNTNPVGKTVTMALPFGEFVYTVQGVFKSEGVKSHIPAQILLSMRNSDFGSFVEAQTSWATNNIFHTYLQLKAGTDIAAFGKKVSALYQQHAGEELKAMGVSKTVFIEQVKHIYLNSEASNEIAPTGNIKYLFILGSIAVFILFIACINFMNLSTARSAKRAKEVGVRKVMGAERKSLIIQFLSESFLLCMVALLLALLFTTMALPLFNRLTGKQLFSFAHPSLIGWLLALTAGTGILAGLYPAFYLSSYKPVSVLKGKIMNSFSAAAIRKGLVIFQFTVSVALILGALVIGRQLHYLKNQDLGFDTHQQIVVPTTNKLVAKNFTVLKNELLKDRAVKTVTSGSGYPGIQIINDMLFYADGKTVNDVVDIHLAAIENDYLETLGIELKYGRTFSSQFTGDSNAIVLNEKALTDLGYDPATAVGKQIHYDWRGVHNTMQIVGVVKDFNYESLHTAIRPFGFSSSNFFANKYLYTIVRANTSNYTSLLKSIEKTWNRVNPGTPFEYSFLDQDFQRNYEKEERTASIVIYFTCMAIVIACLGLFGLAAFSAEQRSREIGVRKVLGASVQNITLLLSKDFIKLVLIAIVLASPIAWFGMNQWLQNFAYRVGISWWLFLLAGGVAVLIALLTISFQAIKSAIANPVKALRSE